MVGAHVNCPELGTPPRCFAIRSASGKGSHTILRDRGFPFLSAFAGSMLLFHRRRVLQIEIVPCTKDLGPQFLQILSIPCFDTRQQFSTSKISQICDGSYSNLAAHIAKRVTHHWERKILHRQPIGQKRFGQPKRG